MPKVGLMKEVSSDDTGEVMFAAELDISEVSKFRAIPNTRSSGERAPEFLVVVGRREMGAMWKKGPDKNGKDYYEIKLNGYPMTREIWIKAFSNEDGTFDLDYSAPRQSSGKGGAE